MFIGRKEELRKLQEALEGNDYRPFRIYGHRRVGKTELIRRAPRHEKELLSILSVREHLLPLTLVCFLNR